MPGKAANANTNSVPAGASLTASLLAATSTAQPCCTSAWATRATSPPALVTGPGPNTWKRRPGQDRTCRGAGDHSAWKASMCCSWRLRSPELGLPGQQSCGARARGGSRDTGPVPATRAKLTSPPAAKIAALASRMARSVTFPATMRPSTGGPRQEDEMNGTVCCPCSPLFPASIDGPIQTSTMAVQCRACAADTTQSTVLGTAARDVADSMRQWSSPGSTLNAPARLEATGTVGGQSPRAPVLTWPADARARPSSSPMAPAAASAAASPASPWPMMAKGTTPRSSMNAAAAARRLAYAAAGELRGIAPRRDVTL
mmetsp:Transcript_38424/g.69649  ORF Transcript_38424/g.69649 Transcript_38424/m.69649 type:complete len:315 (-) Transcript_38424:3086-4030(-)